MAENSIRNFKLNWRQGYYRGTESYRKTYLTHCLTLKCLSQR